MPSTILITGGTRGIGAAVARLATAAGYAVALGYRTGHQAAEALVAQLTADGGTAVAVAADVSTETGVEQLFAEVDRLLPASPLAGLVTSAGISGPGGRVSDITGTGLAGVLSINVIGTILSCREAVRRMARSRGGAGGAIVNVSSMASTIGGRPGRAVYAASKAAVDVFTVGLAKEVAADGIRVNAVRPGMTRTDMTSDTLDDPVKHQAIAATIPIQRIAESSEVAKPILWLLSPEASFVTGALLDVSGGGFVIGPTAPRPGAVR
jgi:NAD(P)-dependent dehydrogenase (short-subunit alcohol dehydrogenase family)